MKNDLIINQLYKKQEYVFNQGPYYLPTKLTSHLVQTSYKQGGLEEKHIKKALEKMAD